MKNSKRWCILTLGLTFTILLVCGAITAVIDPFFHYHGPLDGLQYPINNQRYQNDGIARHFSYDALITGTSMTENFKTSEFDALFGTHSVKLNYSGGAFSEVFSLLEQSVRSNPDLKLVLFGLEEWFLLDGRDLLQANGDFPVYLYDRNPLNDVNYLLNREILWEHVPAVLRYTRQGRTTTTFDDYSAWDGYSPYGAEYVIAGYKRGDAASEQDVLTAQECAVLEDTLTQTVIKLAQENPQIQFIYFFPPYSVLYWDFDIRMGVVERQLAAYEKASELLTSVDNIQLYGFHTDFETVTNLDNYMDIAHYSGQINSLILERISRGEYRLTKDNYQAYWRQVRDFCLHYDYDALLASCD